ncbi:cytochrome P450 2K6-like isoform X3 [Pseudophryne corroboree]|uniref:cytochrome P450 2K6-like isoform X3 n=1 Tax=Pseudophryne corroboree TaxID=495146 RepID=UPI0030820A13
MLNSSLLQATVLSVVCRQAWCISILQKTTFAMDPVTIVLSAVVILLLTYVYNNWKQNYNNFPPGPKPLPIIGNLHMVDKNKPMNTCLELSKKYGPVLGIHLGMIKMVVLSGYDTIKDALINHAEEFSDRLVPPIMSKMAKDNGIIYANGENWKVMRRFTISTLRDFGMGKKSIENKIVEEAACLTQAIKSYGGKPFDNLPVINAAVANIIVSILLNRRFEYDDPTILKLMYLINTNIKLMGKPIAMEKPESTLYYHNDNLTVLIADLFGAGMDTTSTTLRWGLLLMMKYPDIQKKVQNEIERVVGSAQPRVEHRIQMPYTDAVLHEIQRFGDILPGSALHSTSQDVTFRGYFIPKGTFVIPFLTTALRDAAYFEKPDEFYPEHFLTSEGQFKKNEAFIPFSLGKRSCAGQNLAKMELFVFFTALLQNFTFQGTPGAQLDLTPELGATNAPRPYDTCAIPRS